MGDTREIGRPRHRALAGVQPEYLRAPVDVGKLDDDLPVETAWTQKRVVEDVLAVGGSRDDHAGLRPEAVHLDEHLVPGLLPLVVALTHASAALASDGIELVDEDDCRCRIACLRKQVADAGGAYADQRFDELRARDREEVGRCLASYGAIEKRLSGARWSGQDHALRGAGA